MFQKTLDASFSENARGQDTLKAVGFAFMNPYGRRVVWKHIEAMWPYITKRFAGGHLFSRFVAPVAHFTTCDEAAEVERFFKKHATEGIERTLAQTAEQIRSHAAWYERDEKRIKIFLGRMV